MFLENIVRMCCVSRKVASFFDEDEKKILNFPKRGRLVPFERVFLRKSLAGVKYTCNYEEIVKLCKLVTKENRYMFSSGLEEEKIREFFLQSFLSVVTTCYYKESYKKDLKRVGSLPIEQQITLKKITRAIDERIELTFPNLNNHRIRFSDRLKAKYYKQLISSPNLNYTELLDDLISNNRPIFQYSSYHLPPINEQYINLLIDKASYGGEDNVKTEEETLNKGW